MKISKITRASTFAGVINRSNFTESFWVFCNARHIWETQELVI